MTASASVKAGTARATSIRGWLRLVHADLSLTEACGEPRDTRYIFRGRRHLRGSPARLLVQRRLREPPQGVNGAAIGHHRARGKQRTRRLVHERHELVGKAGHGASDADPAHVGTAADPAHPAALPHVALHHRAPAAQLHDARARAVFFGELGLFVVPAAVAALVDGLAEKPRRAQRVVKRNHRRATGGHVEQIEQRLHEVVGLNRAARHADDRNVRRAISSSSQDNRARPMQPVGLPSMAWIPPYVAQVPAAMTAQAWGASRSIHSQVVIGWPVSASVPKEAQ